LLKHSRVDPSAVDNSCFLCASIDCRIGLMKRLLYDPRVDPSARNNEAIKLALKYRKLDIVKVLLQEQRVLLGLLKDAENKITLDIE
jgi:hypothetical protein